MKKRILSLILAAVMLIGVMISAEMTSAAERQLYFDVEIGRWSEADIKFATDEGLMKGVGGSRFDPEGVVDRAMVVTVLYRYAGSPAVEGENTFTDVPAGEWYEAPVIWAASKGIVKGTGNNKYEPLMSITREDLTTIIKRYAEMQVHADTEQAENIEGFADYATISDYAVAPMSWAKAAGLINGTTNTTMGPKEGATREQFAAIMHRYDNAFGVVYNKPVYGQNYVEPEYEKVEDADVYVSTTGDDSAPGTKTEPVKTFAEAKNRVRALKGTKDGEIKVAFMAGNYGTLDGIIFELEDRGTSTQPITYCAYGDGDVVFSNGVNIENSEFEPITSEEAEMFPEAAREHIYKVDLNGKVDIITSNTVLFGGNGLCDEARYPNKTDEMSEFKNMTTRVVEEGKQQKEYDKLLMQYWLGNKVDAFSTYEGLKITGHLRTGWFLDTFPVKSYDRDTNYITIDFENWNLDGNAYPISNSYPLAYEGRMEDTVFFHNLAEFLDAEGEYWFDTKTKTLYVYNPVGDYSIPTGGTFIFVGYGTSYLNFVGLDFNGTTGYAISTWGANDHITFDGCEFGNVSGKNVIRGGGVKNFTVKNCEFYNFVCGGVVIDSSADRYLLENGNNAIENNYFHDFGRPSEFDEAVAIQLYRDVGGRIAHNEFVNGAHGAIRYDSCIDVVIEYNVFDNMMATTADFGAVYTYILEMTHRGNKIRYNLFTNMRANGAQHGVYLDGACGQEVYGNLFYNCGSTAIVFNGSRDNLVYDNISINFGRCSLFAYNAYLQNITDSSNPEYAAHNYLSSKPEAGHPGYEKWVERWPILYQYTFDINDTGDYYCVYTSVNHLYRNKTIGGDLNFGEGYDTYADAEDIEAFGVGENPYFADPANGDYTIVNTENFKEVFPFDKVGRK